MSLPFLSSTQKTTQSHQNLKTLSPSSHRKLGSSAFGAVTTLDPSLHWDDEQKATKLLGRTGKGCALQKTSSALSYINNAENHPVPSKPQNPFTVIPAKAGSSAFGAVTTLDPSLHWDDEQKATKLLGRTGKGCD
jgi:hypothetical protein